MIFFFLNGEMLKIKESSLCHIDVDIWFSTSGNHLLLCGALRYKFSHVALLIKSWCSVIWLFMHKSLLSYSIFC
jgi:hypothetical protein